MKQLTLSEIQSITGGLNPAQITYYAGTAASTLVGFAAQRMFMPNKPIGEAAMSSLVLPLMQLFANMMTTESCNRIFEQALPPVEKKAQ